MYINFFFFSELIVFWTYQEKWVFLWLINSFYKVDCLIFSIYVDMIMFYVDLSYSSFSSKGLMLMFQPFIHYYVINSVFYCKVCSSCIWGCPLLNSRFCESTVYVCLMALLSDVLSIVVRFSSDACLARILNTEWQYWLSRICNIH